MLVFEPTLSLETKLKAHNAAWQHLLGAVDQAGIVRSLRPTTLSVKVANKSTLFKVLLDNASQIEQVHIGTVNARYIASAMLKKPFEGLSILKILERRADSDDPLGLDSIDYLVDDLEKAFEIFQGAGLKIVKEHNDMHAWLSLRFGENNEFEAKMTDHLVLEVAIKELKLANTQLLR